MVSNSRWLNNSLRIYIALFFAILMVGCAGRSGPTLPDMETAGTVPNPADNYDSTGALVQNPGSLRGQDPSTLRQYAEDEVLVVLNHTLSDAEITSSLRNYSLRLIDQIPCRWGTVYRLQITDGTPVEDMVSRLRSDSSVRMVEPNYVRYFQEVPYWPNDPLWESDDPGTDPMDSVYDQWGPAMIGASDVWNEMKGSEDVIVAVIDSGVNFNHEDLHDHIWINEDEIADNEIDDDENGWIDDTWGWDMYENDNDPSDPGDAGSYHGSACSGVITAVQDNGVGCTGIAPGVRVMELRIGFDDGYDSYVIESLEYARINGAEICSMSFGGPFPSEIVHEEIIDVWDDGNGLLLLASAGNYDETDYLYPSAYDEVLTVGATIPWTVDGDPVDEQRLQPSVELGYYWGSNYGDWLHVMGFGDKYVTVDGLDIDTYYDGLDDDNFFGGTSNACPMAAAVMALIRLKFPSETPAWSWDRIIETADDLHTPGFDIQTGYGRINALRAIYGSDRFADLEDVYGFVPLELPDSQVFDTIHHVQGNPYFDTEDLYRFESTKTGYLVLEMDIFTWGTDLDLAVYSDRQLTQLIEESVGPNHAGTSRESILLNVTEGEEFFLKVFSPSVGNSTTYGLNVFNTANELSITAENAAPHFIHQQGENIPFLKLTLEIGFGGTLDELIITKQGTLPNENLGTTRLYIDTNSNGEFDTGDELLSEQTPVGTNRSRFSDLNLYWDYHENLVLFFASDLSMFSGDAVVRFGLESYKDVTTEENCPVLYTDFPIMVEMTPVGTDTDPPEWSTTVGIQSAEGFYNSALIGWNAAADFLTPPVKYNVYYTDTLPFDIGNAVKISDVSAEAGDSTDFRTSIWDLPPDVEQHFVVRAEDQAGNEDENLVVLSCTPASGGDPSHPMVIASYPVDWPSDLAGDENLLIVGTWDGLFIYDNSNPMDLNILGTWYDDWPSVVGFRGELAYCLGWDAFSVINISNPSNPVTTDYTGVWGYAMGFWDTWAYTAGYSDELTPIDMSDPYNIHQEFPTLLPWDGYPQDIEVTDQYLYVAHYNTGIVALDRSNPANPTIVNTFGSDDVQSLLVVGDILYAVDWSTGALSLYDLGADPEDPPLLDMSSGGPGSYGYSVIVVGDFAYVSRSYYGLVVFDISTPSDIEYIGDLELYGATAMINVGPIIYVLTEDALNIVI